jgi:hypothetical protein
MILPSVSYAPSTRSALYIPSKLAASGKPTRGLSCFSPASHSCLNFIYSYLRRNLRRGADEPEFTQEYLPSLSRKECFRTKCFRFSSPRTNNMLLFEGRQKQLV